MARSAAARRAVVSSESEQLVLVDRFDQPKGFASKAACHDGDGMLHRAFSLFIFNDRGELLLQQRSGQKRLWPLFWSNSCCSHPRQGEELDDAIHRRLAQELGMESQLEFVYKFQYQARFGPEGSENELCSVFLGRAAGDVHANENEIEAWRYVSPADLNAEMEAHPDRFTPWFKMEWERLNEEFGGRLEAYLSPPEA
ncbi:MAG: isopentenyl-diphosphate Delta-isomerase [Pseudomonadota bacterium]